MPTFRVLGEKMMMYWVELEAKDSYEAYDLADKLTTDKWNLIEQDNVIEPVDVYLNDEEQELYVKEEEVFEFDPINVVGGE
jgi:isochorismate synthase EntC